VDPVDRHAGHDRPRRGVPLDEDPAEALLPVDGHRALVDQIGVDHAVQPVEARLLRAEQHVLRAGGVDLPEKGAPEEPRDGGAPLVVPEPDAGHLDDAPPGKPGVDMFAA
jgi:hypothetical protein